MLFDLLVRFFGEGNLADVSVRQDRGRQLHCCDLDLEVW